MDTGIGVPPKTEMHGFSEHRPGAQLQSGFVEAAQHGNQRLEPSAMGAQPRPAPPAGDGPRLALGHLHPGSSSADGVSPVEPETADPTPVAPQRLIPASAPAAHAGSDAQGAGDPPSDGNAPLSDWGGLSEGVLQLVSTRIGTG